MTFHDKTILVTGGAGFIGSHLCEALLEHGAKKVIAFDNLSAGSSDNIKHLLKNPRFDLIVRDVSGYANIEPYVLSSDIVYHLAASNVGNSVLDPLSDLETNAGGILNILLAARLMGNIKIIHVSSGSVENPSTPYAISKLTGEQYAKFYAKEYGVDVAILRPFHVFGPRQDINGRCGVINIFLSKILRGEAPVVWGSGEQVKCFTFVRDVVAALLLLAQKDSVAGKAFEAASDTRININDLAKKLIKLYSKDKKMKPIYTKPKIGENMELSPNSSSLMKLGWDWHWEFETGLEMCKAWVENQLIK